ncbi:MAG: DNA internalization-related competence protein ComEC/Rec2 [Candidatus Omnitrophica bacterium]|nr:DNA internalization-related competence protein ComEC/Rec2 [Candidatus Omnitrophota bacterium]
MNRPLLPFITAFLAGTAIAAATAPGVEKYAPALFACMAATLFLSAVFTKKNAPFVVFLALFFLFLGAGRYAVRSPGVPEELKAVLREGGGGALVHGTVVSMPEEKGKGYARHSSYDIKADGILLYGPGDPVSSGFSGLVRVRDHDTLRQVMPGDILAVEGRLSVPKGRTNPHGFDYRAYLRTQGIALTMSAPASGLFAITGKDDSPVPRITRRLYRLRKRASAILRTRLSGPSYALVEAMLFGVKTGLRRLGIREVFERTGTMHITAVSGLHVGMFAFALTGLLRLLRLPRKLSYGAGILGVFLFAAFTGLRPPAVRAAIMAAFIMLGILAGRRTDVVSSVLLSAFIIVFLWPYKIASAGFILSYIAVFSIIYLTPMVRTFPDGAGSLKHPRAVRKARNYFFGAVSVSIAIFIGMSPIIAYYFRIVSPGLVLANLVAVPVLFAVLVSSPVLIVMGALPFLSVLSWIPARGIEGMIGFLVHAMRAISGMPCAYAGVPSPGIIFIVFYYAALAGTVYVFREKKRNLIFPVFLGFALIFWMAGPGGRPRAPGENTVTFFDTGRSDAVLIESGERTFLVDAASGGEKTGFNAARSVIAPYLIQENIKVIDVFFVTHFHEDHAGGAPYILDNFRIKKAVTSKAAVREERYGGVFRSLKKEFEEEGAEVILAERGDRVECGGGVEVKILNPPKEAYGDQNDDSLVMKMSLGKGFEVLLCGDVMDAALENLVNSGYELKADIIKLPHHGQGYQDPVLFAEFIAIADPDYAVITNSGREDIPELVTGTLEEQGVDYYITGESGAVVFREDHGEISVETAVK